jgi:SAM-dependent methyltransferase
MAHAEQQGFCNRVKQQFPTHFENVKVLDCGSYDVNGNNRYLFSNCDYTGIDLMPGPNVTEVSAIHEYLIGTSNVFDLIISTECFEHDMHFKKSIKRIMELLKPSGLFLFTCATVGRPRHGTVNHSPGDSPPTVAQGGTWGKYYRNVPIKDATRIGKKFSKHGVEINGHDLYFWGHNKLSS